MTLNLNELTIENADGPPRALADFSTQSADGQTRVYFRDIEKHLLAHINEADIVVGSVAWLTHETILDALATKHGVAIVVQKEDFLRPDIEAPTDWKAQLRQRYSRLPATLTRLDNGLMGTILHMMSCCVDPTIDAVRCLGSSNVEKRPASPRAHNKFVVFCRLTPPSADGESLAYEPYEVWTGSFNFTGNATRSFENAVVIREPRIVRAYFEEFAQIEALSEPLDWESNWVEPQWRIGT